MRTSWAAGTILVRGWGIAHGSKFSETASNGIDANVRVALDLYYFPTLVHPLPMCEGLSCFHVLGKGSL